MGRHKLPYNMKKPNEHHKYWRYVLSTGPRTEISTKTKVKYEAERIAKEAYQAAILKQRTTITFGEYSKTFFLPDCKLTLRKQASNKPISPDILGMKRGQLITISNPNLEILVNSLCPTLLEAFVMSLVTACFWLFAQVKVTYFREELIFTFKMWHSAKSFIIF